MASTAPPSGQQGLRYSYCSRFLINSILIGLEGFSLIAECRHFLTRPAWGLGGPTKVGGAKQEPDVGRGFGTTLVRSSLAGANKQR